MSFEAVIVFCIMTKCLIITLNESCNYEVNENNRNDKLSKNLYENTKVLNLARVLLVYQVKGKARITNLGHRLSEANLFLTKHLIYCTEGSNNHNQNTNLFEHINKAAFDNHEGLSEQLNALNKFSQLKNGMENQKDSQDLQEFIRKDFLTNFVR